MTIENCKSQHKAHKSFVCNGDIISLETPLVMGIINITSDSFYSKSQFRRQRRIVAKAKEILEQGGTFIDVGACSTRPHSMPISEAEEIKRLAKSLEAIRKNFPHALLSVDTYRANVARIVVEDFNVNMINDISAGTMDIHMIDTIAKLAVPYVAMHMQGTPLTMQNNPTYENVVKEIISFFAHKVEQWNNAGISNLIIDPGFGFGKTLEHNFSLLQNLEAFKLFSEPLMVGLSRKSMIYKPLSVNPEQALNGTTALNTIALLKGANILRVHDVKEAVEAIQLTSLTTCQANSFQ